MTILAIHRRNQRAFTLVEVVISLALAVLVYGGILKGYVIITDQAEWSC